MMSGISFSDAFVSGESYPVFRIPAVITTQKGTVLAFAEGRQHWRDQSYNNMVMVRSEDNGKTWGKVHTIADFGKDSINNPQPVIDAESGKIILFFQTFPYPSYVRALVPGYDEPKKKIWVMPIPFMTKIPKRVPIRICRAYVSVSEDDGVTWSKPEEITKQVKRPTTVNTVVSGPGVGIQKRRTPHKGRIIMPFNQGPRGDWKVYTVYSDDSGSTWQYGNSASTSNLKGSGNEVQMVELTDGRLMLNTRVQWGNKLRANAFSDDGGENWSPLQEVPMLIDPQCQGSTLRFTDPLDGEKSRILFSNPASKLGRKNGTVKLSYDEGQTWPVSKTIMPDEYSYSCLTVLKDKSIGCLFETGKSCRERVRFARFTLDWLTDGQEKIT